MRAPKLLAAALSASAVLVCCPFGPEARAQEAGRFSAVVKATRLPEVGVQGRFTERLSARVLAGLATDIESTNGIWNAGALYRLSEASQRLSNYAGVGITMLDFGGESLYLSVVYGGRYALTERLHLFGEVGLDVGDEPTLSLIYNTGVGIGYRF
jgi:hypothetical protein